MVEAIVLYNKSLSEYRSREKKCFSYRTDTITSAHSLPIIVEHSFHTICCTSISINVQNTAKTDTFTPIKRFVKMIQL